MHHKDQKQNENSNNNNNNNPVKELSLNGSNVFKYDALSENNNNNNSKTNTPKI